MKIIKIKILSFFLFLAFPFYSMAEVVQLIDESVSTKMDKVPNYSVSELKELQDLKLTIIHFVKSSPNENLKILTSKYKKTYKDIEKILKSSFDKETYSKIDFRKIIYHDDKSVTVKVNLYWENEGYGGIQTFYFECLKKQGIWLIDWIIH